MLRGVFVFFRSGSVPWAVIVTGLITIPLVLFGSAVAKPKLEIGKPPPLMQWTSASGDSLSWAEIAQGRPVVMVFWATWCKGCKKEWPKLKKLAEQYSASPKAATWVSVSLGEPADRVAQVAKEWNLPGMVLVDPREERGKALGIDFVPSLLVVGPDGKTVYTGASNVGKLNKLLATYTDETDLKKDLSP